MSEDLKDILSNLNPGIDQETLMLYLQGKLSTDQQHEVEKQMMDDEFNAEALDGLQEIKDKKKITSLVEQLNKDLKKKTEKKKRFRKKLQLHIDPWLIIAVVLILLIAIIAYILVHKRLNG